MAAGGDGYPDLSARATTRDVMDQVVADSIAAAGHDLPDASRAGSTAPARGARPSSNKSRRQVRKSVGKARQEGRAISPGPPCVCRRRSSGHPNKSIIVDMMFGLSYSVDVRFV